MNKKIVWRMIQGLFLVWTGMAIFLLVLILRPYVEEAGNENAIYLAWSLVATSMVWLAIFCIKALDKWFGK